MKYTLTLQQQATLRMHPQRVEYYAAIHRPRVIFSGSLIDLPTIFRQQPASSISVAHFLAGSPSDAKPGMTILFGTAEFMDDLGVARFRATSGASRIMFATVGSGLVNMKQGMNITILEDYRLWPIHPSYDVASSRWQIDYDDYTSQLSQYGPQVIMGPPDVLTLSDGKAVGQYTGNLTYSHTPGASITGSSWVFQDGQTVTSALGSSAAPVRITYLNASPFGGYHTLKVEDGNGASHIGQRLTFVFGSGNQAPSRIRFEPITGGLKSGGYRTRIYLSEAAGSEVIQDGAQVVIFEKASYGSVASSIGGNYYARDNVVLVGRIVSESLRIEPFTGELSFALETTDGEMRRTHSYDMFLEGHSQASDWDMASGLNLDRAAIALTKYRSTLTNVADFHPAGGAAESNELAFRDLPMGNLFDQLTHNYQAAFGMVAADMQGTVWAQLDAQVTGLSANLPSAKIAIGDRRDAIQIEKDHVDINSQYRLYAVQGGTYEPLGAESPGVVGGYFGGRQEVSRNLTVADQQTLATWAGNVRARENNRLKRVLIPLAGNFRYDTVPQSRFDVSLSPTHNLRGHNWVNKTFLGNETTLNYTALGQYSLTDLTLEASVNGHGGSAITFPRPENITPGPTPPPGPGPDPGPIPIPTGDGPSTMFAAYSRKLLRTFDFNSASPTWEVILSVDDIVDFILDPFDPANSGYVLRSNGLNTFILYYSSNLGATTPTFTQVLTSAISSSQTGQSWAAPFQVHASTLQRGRVYVNGRGTSNLPRVWTSSDYGATWSVGNTFGSGSTIRARSIDASDYNLGTLFATTGEGDTYRSLDHGATWSLALNWIGSIIDGPCQVFLPLEGNSDDSIVLVTGGDGSPSEAAYVVKSLSGGGGPVEISPLVLGVPYGAGYHGGHFDLTGNLNSLYLLGYAGTATTSSDPPKLFYSDDGGNSWSIRFEFTAVGAGANLGAYSAVGLWPYNNLTVFVLSNDSGGPLVSFDGGFTWNGRNGNMTTILGGTIKLQAGIPMAMVPVWV